MWGPLAGKFRADLPPVNLATIATTFTALFFAELGDKTQLTVLAFVAGGRDRLSVAIGGSAALVASTLLAVVVGSGLTKIVDPGWVKLGAAVIFLVVGVLVAIDAIGELRG